MTSLSDFDKETPHCEDHKLFSNQDKFLCVVEQKAFVSRGNSTLLSERVCYLQYVYHKLLFPSGRWAASDIISSCSAWFFSSPFQGPRAHG